MESRQRDRWLIALLAFLAYCFVMLQVANLVRQQSFAELYRLGQHDLDRYVARLRAPLQRFEYLPQLLAEDQRSRQLLNDPQSGRHIDTLNRYLQRVVEISGASDIYLMNRNGLTLASSNWHKVRTFVGRNFGFRPYFQQALKGKQGRYFALGTTSQRRGYYFAYPVREGDQVLGVIAVKVGLEALEVGWRADDGLLLVTDPDGVVFISSDPQWRFSTIAPLSEERRQRIYLSNRYPNVELPLMPLQRSNLTTRDGSLYELAELWLQKNGQGQRRYLIQSRYMGEEEWRLQLLTPLKPVTMRVTWAVIIATILFLVLLFFGLYLRQRRKRYQERSRYEAQTRLALKASRDELEQRVVERTSDLQREVEKHKQTEVALRRAQDELVQAAKLAMLGQMSAGLSHELNQPLAAIRSYTDNARLLLQRQRCEEAEWNLAQIAELVERMAQISSQLKLFARKTDGERAPVSLRNAVDAARSILRPQFQRSGTALSLDLPLGELLVWADPVRLEQVLVNLMSNADHAMEKCSERWIKLSAYCQGSRLFLLLHDNGPGIPSANLEKIFNPFFTTRKSGLGLGLSISHDIVESMGGRLSAANHPSGGAVFSVELEMAAEWREEVE